MTTTPILEHDRMPMQAERRLAHPGEDEYGAYYRPYVARVPAGDALAELARQQNDFRRLTTTWAGRGGHRYADGKWTVREVVGHLADAERIFSYRALRAARGDATPLPSFDENAYVAAGGFDDRTLEDVVSELVLARASTIALFQGLPPEADGRRGVASGAGFTVRAMAYILAGHAGHHLAVLAERYG